MLDLKHYSMALQNTVKYLQRAQTNQTQSTTKTKRSNQ